LIKRFEINKGNNISTENYTGRKKKLTKTEIETDEELIFLSRLITEL